MYFSEQAVVTFAFRARWNETMSTYWTDRLVFAIVQIMINDFFPPLLLKLIETKFVTT
jgi:hypothetical protein